MKCDFSNCCADREQEDLRVPHFAVAIAARTPAAAPAHKMVDFTAQFKVCKACRKHRWPKSQAEQALLRDFTRMLKSHKLHAVSKIFCRWDRPDLGPMAEPLPPDTELEITLEHRQGGKSSQVFKSDAASELN